MNTLVKAQQQFSAGAFTGEMDPSVSDFYELLKPRVMRLVIFTAIVGMMVAPGSIHPWIGGIAILCIAVAAGASGALNMWYESDIDGLMKRTANRPLPSGRMSRDQALAFASVLAIGSVVVMGTLVNWVAAAFLAFTIFFYVVIYTMWLKRSTAQNIVIGGAAGAFPPMVAWTAVTGSIDLASISLFAIIFMWTPPHFWALALFRQIDYSRAGVPMLPVVAGPDETRRQILMYSIAMVPVTILPAFLGIGGLLYLATSAILSGIFLWYAVQVYRIRQGEAADRATKGLFRYSILFLFLIFSSLLVEKLAGLSAFTPVWALRA